MKFTRREMVVLAAATGASAYAQQKPPAIQVPSGFKKVENQPYSGGNNRRQMLDLYLPEKPDAPLPVVIWVHGGAWRSGSKDTPSPALGLLAHGYAVVHINYRLSSAAQFPAQLDDCKSAIRWLRRRSKEFSLDPAHFGVWGSSAGGHLVSLLGTTGPADETDQRPDSPDPSSRVQAVCDWYGPTDFTLMDQQAPPNAPFKHDAPDAPEADLIGGPVQSNKDRAKRANPITYITKDDPPFLIMHGDKDGTVPVGQSRIFHAALERAGVPVTYVEVTGAGHGPGIHTPENIRRVREFFDRHLKVTGPKSVPPPK